jgi:hypothetical protein
VRKLIEVDAKLHDVRTLAGDAKPVSPRIRQPSIERKIVLIGCEAELAGGGEKKHSAGLQRAVDALQRIRPVLDVFEYGVGDDGVEVIRLQGILLDVAETDV